VGARWIGTAGSVSYTLAYMYTHQLTPPIPSGFYQRWDEEKGALENDIEVILTFPRQHLVGFSLEYLLPNPVSTVVRLEASYVPNNWFAGASVPSGELYSKDFVLGEDFWTFLPKYKKQVLSYGVQMMRPTFLRFLNPNQTFMLVAQFLHSVVLDFDPAERIVSVPGFDSTKTRQHTFTVVGAITTSYLHGMLQPKIVGAYIPAPGAHSGFLIAELGLLLGNSWRMQVGWINFFGQDPYQGVGLFRDRDEAYLRVLYQF